MARSPQELKGDAGVEDVFRRSHAGHDCRADHRNIRTGRSPNCDATSQRVPRYFALNFVLFHPRARSVGVGYTSTQTSFGGFPRIAGHFKKPAVLEAIH